jgi:glycolate oxidase
MGGDNLAVKGGIVVATRAMCSIREIDTESHTIQVEAGATIQQINDALKPYGLWFPHDPESKPTSTVGAAIACDNDGTFGIKYGGMVDYLTEAVLTVPGGETYRLGHRKASCSSSGYKLLWTLIGSEGTLGIISSVRLRVFPRPEHREVGLWVAPSVKAAMEGIIALHKAGVWVESAHVNDKYRLDYYTHAYHQKTGKAAEIPPGYQALLALTFAGDEDVAAFSHGKALATLASLGIEPFDNKEITEYWWASKHTLSWEKNKWSASQKKEKFGAADVAVPIAKIPAMYDAFLKSATENGLPIVGTAIYNARPHYSPSISFAVFVDDHDSAKVESFYRYVGEMSTKALELGGTMSSYIGDGTRLKDLTPREHGAGLSLMWQLKRIFDPSGIMNPGKIFPDDINDRDLASLRQEEMP